MYIKVMAKIGAEAISGIILLLLILLAHYFIGLLAAVVRKFAVPNSN